MKDKIYRAAIILVMLFVFLSVGKTGSMAPGNDDYKMSEEHSSKEKQECFIKESSQEEDIFSKEDLQTESISKYEQENIEIIRKQMKSIEDGLSSFEADEEFVENIIGYTLYRNRKGDLWFGMDPDYLVAEEMLGKGVYVSEHMGEIEIFLGNVLKEVLKERGKISSENNRYFTDWAVRQLEETDWDFLDDGWEPEMGGYYRSYEQNNLSGKQGYLFRYYFDQKKDSIRGESANYVRFDLAVDKNGMICEISMKIAEGAGVVTNCVNLTGLYEDEYSETIIRDGITGEGKVLLDFSKYYYRFHEEYNPGELPDGGLSASAIAEMLTDMLESRGGHGTLYKDNFIYDTMNYEKFLNLPWEQVEENWKADEKYDCEYRDRTEIGFTGFRFYIYPDYDKMETDQAKAVIFDCNVGKSGKNLSNTDMFVFELSREEHGNGIGEDMVKVVEAGELLTGRGGITVPVPRTRMPHVMFSQYVFCGEAGASRESREIWGYQDMAELAGYLGDIFVQTINNEEMKKRYYDYSESFSELLSEKGKDRVYFGSVRNFLERAGEDWKADENYDCFYMKENEQAERVHLKYYFYPVDIGNDREFVLVLDFYLSEDGIEDFNVNSYMRKAGVSLFD